MQRFTVLTSQLLKIQQPLLNISNIHNDYFQLIFNVKKPKIAPPIIQIRGSKMPNSFWNNEACFLFVCFVGCFFLKTYYLFAS